jgi:hypothetical protein
MGGETSDSLWVLQHGQLISSGIRTWATLGYLPVSWYLSQNPLTKMLASHSHLKIMSGCLWPWEGTEKWSASWCHSWWLPRGLICIWSLFTDKHSGPPDWKGKNNFFSANETGYLGPVDVTCVDMWNVIKSYLRTACPRVVVCQVYLFYFIFSAIWRYTFKISILYKYIEKWLSESR